MRNTIGMSYEQFFNRMLGTSAMLGLALSMALMGCAKKEPVIEINTPAGGVSVDKKENVITGEKSIEVKTDNSASAP